MYQTHFSADIEMRTYQTIKRITSIYFLSLKTKIY